MALRKAISGSMVDLSDTILQALLSYRDTDFQKYITEARGSTLSKGA